MYISKMHLSRRTMLRGLGAALALPVLDAMVPALNAASTAPVRRLGVFYVPNGMSMPYWFPKTEGPLAQLPPTLKSLEAFKDRVLLCGGLADEPANRVKGGGDHARSPARANIQNPARLYNAAGINQFCGNCHRQPPAPGEDTDFSNPWNARHQPGVLVLGAAGLAFTEPVRFPT